IRFPSCFSTTQSGYWWNGGDTTKLNYGRFGGTQKWTSWPFFCPRALISLPVPADAICIMTIAIARSRGSKRKLPPEYARSLSFDDMMAGAGGPAGSSGQQQVWKRYPERWVTRGLITRSGIVPRRCRMVQYLESVPN